MDFTRLDAAEEQGKIELEKVGGDPSRLPFALQPVAYLLTAQAIIDNGGFQYFFESEWPFKPPYSKFVESYRAIGADGPADKLERAVAIFPFPNPERDSDARIKFMSTLDEKHEFHTLGNEVCGDEQVWELLDAYILAHPEAFQASDNT